MSCMLTGEQRVTAHESNIKNVEQDLIKDFLLKSLPRDPRDLRLPAEAPRVGRGDRELPAHYQLATVALKMSMRI